MEIRFMFRKQAYVLSFKKLTIWHQQEKAICLVREYYHNQKVTYAEIII